jgi:excisionase family DNA binding protein
VPKLSPARLAVEGHHDGQPDQWLTVDQLAYRWQVSPRTIRRKIKTKQIRVIRIGRAIRIHPKTADLPDETA